MYEKWIQISKNIKMPFILLQQILEVEDKLRLVNNKVSLSSANLRLLHDAQKNVQLVLRNIEGNRS